MTDPKKPQTWIFPCYQWLSLYESDCQIRRSLKPLVHKKSEKVGMCSYMHLDFIQYMCSETPTSIDTGGGGGVESAHTPCINGMSVLSGLNILEKINGRSVFAQGESKLLQCIFHIPRVCVKYEMVDSQQGG